MNILYTCLSHTYNQTWLGLGWLHLRAHVCSKLLHRPDANYASKTVVHTSMATRGQPFPCSLWSILWPLNRLSWPLPRREIKRAKSCGRLRTSCTTNRELQKMQQVGYRLVVELVHILRLFHITTESYQAVLAVHMSPARCMRVCTYPIFSYSSAKSNLKSLH